MKKTLRDPSVYLQEAILNHSLAPTTTEIAMIQPREASTGESSNEAYGERRLWTAVIVSAVEDWRTGTLRARREAQQFLFDDDKDFARVCASAGLEPGSFRAKLLKIGCRVDTVNAWKHPLAA